MTPLPEPKPDPHIKTTGQWFIFYFIADFLAVNIKNR
jgi:hypothetical protein